MFNCLNVYILTNFKYRIMKKVILFVLIMIFSSGTSTVTAGKHDPKTAENSMVVATKEGKLSEEELNRITNRVEEIYRMDKSNLTAKEKRELRQELRGYRDHGYRHRGGGVYYIGGGTLLLIILLVILLAG